MGSSTPVNTVLPFPIIAEALPGAKEPRDAVPAEAEPSPLALLDHEGKGAMVAVDETRSPADEPSCLLDVVEEVILRGSANGSIAAVCGAGQERVAGRVAKPPVAG